MLKPIIKVENLSKQYRLGTVGTGTIREDIQRWWYKVQGKEDPFLKIGETNDRNTKSNNEYVWALKDINFEVMPGEVLGIIGKNGAGKSTLLKILSKVTGPTTGYIDFNGRIGSLLEVGTGFHPDLTGRENIFLNGAILGMTRQEIQSKLDEIIDFSGCERYIDTPVKRYSSGMIVRLGFAVAAHLEPEILVVDEVLAVGDAEFQKKAIGKMQDVSRNEGRTVLFVSHNMQAIAKLCTRGILLNNGVITNDCEIKKIIKIYSDENIPTKSIYAIEPPINKEDIIGYITKLQIENLKGEIIKKNYVGEPWQIRINFKINKPVHQFIIALNTSNIYTNINTTWSDKIDLIPGNYQAIFCNDNLVFAPDNYIFTVGLSENERSFQYIQNAGTFQISEIADNNLSKRIIKTTYSGLILNQNSVTILDKNN